MTKNLFSVMLFAFFGGCLRSLCSQVWGGFWGTIMVNLIGSFLLAFLTYRTIVKRYLASWLNPGLCTGLVGSFTTFGTFSLQSVQLLQQSFLAGVGFMALNLLGGFLLAVLGFRLAMKINRRTGND